MSLKTAIYYSPNFSTIRRIKKKIKFIVIHYTGMIGENKAINRLTDSKSKVSSHYFIKKNGKIILMVPDLFEAWHAGISGWKNIESLNKYSIGIEIQNKGHEYGYENYTKPQINSLIILCKYLMKKYKIKRKNIIGHSDISYNRKKDPGEKFPWKILAKNKIGYWHNIEQKKLKKFRKIKTSHAEKKDMVKALKIIGYYIKRNNLKMAKLIKAFQRRYRPEIINGLIDRESLIIAEKISKL